MAVHAMLVRIELVFLFPFPFPLSHPSRQLVPVTHLAKHISFLQWLL